MVSYSIDVPPSNLRATIGGTCLQGRHLDRWAGLVVCPAKAGAAAFALCFTQ